MQTYKSITSVSDEFGNKGLHSFMLGPEIKIDHGRHRGDDCSITQLNVVNWDSARLLFYLTVRIQVTNIIDCKGQ